MTPNDGHEPKKPIQAMNPMRLCLCAAVLVAITSAWVEAQPTAAPGQRLEACSRGDVTVCFALLRRPRLDAGRRAAIEFHLAELDRALVACSAGDATACSTLAERYPDLPADLRAGRGTPLPRP